MRAPSRKTDKQLGEGVKPPKDARRRAKHPFITGALKHIATITKNARRYHVYRVAREANEVY